MKRILSLFMAILIVAGFAGCSAKAESEELTTESNETATETSSEEAVENTEIRFTDDSGREIVLDKPAEKVISLYSVHTENLYALEAGDTVIGVGMSDKYPEEVLTKTQYSYKDDAEVVIAANPDVLIVRTMIDSRYPEYIKTIEDAGIVVVNLYCSEYSKFDSYMNRLGMIVGKEDKAAELVGKFHEEVEHIKARGEGIIEKKSAYFESIGKKFKTATPTSFAGKALVLVGVENVAADLEFDGNSTVETYGEEALLAKAADIDVYIAQKGAMNKIVSIEEIKGRPGFDTIKAVKEDQIIIIDEKLISGATMRYLEGLKELQDTIYGVE